jgi:hypothetical protein
MVRDAAVHAGVEAEDDGLGGGGQHDVGFGDGAHGAVDDLQRDLVGFDLVQR